MVMSQQITIKLRPHNSISNKINKYIMMTRTIRSTTMNMAKLITANSSMLTMVQKTISNTTNSNNNTMTTIIISIDMIRLRCHQVIDIF